MNEKTVGMLAKFTRVSVHTYGLCTGKSRRNAKKNVYEYPELSNAVTCMNYVNKETEIPLVLMMHGLADYECYCNGDDSGIYGSNGRNGND